MILLHGWDPMHSWNPGITSGVLFCGGVIAGVLCAGVRASPAIALHNIIIVVCWIHLYGF